MLGRLTQAGWEVVAAPEAAQLLLVNTCGFIQEACQEAVDTILELARHKEADPGQTLSGRGLSGAAVWRGFARRASGSRLSHRSQRFSRP